MAWTEKNGDGYRGVYRAPDGTRPRPRPSRQEEGDRGCPRRGAQDRNGTWFSPTAGAITFVDYFEKQWYPSRGGELNTRRNYRSHYNAEQHGLKVTWGNVELRHITSSSVQSWDARRARRRRPDDRRRP